MKKIAKEFKQFIMRGNVLDMAVGVIIATAFGNITNTLINSIIMPFIGWLIGDIDLSRFDIVLRPAVMENDTVLRPELVLGVGTFISTVINFLLIALIVFVIIKTFNRIYRKKDQQQEKKEDAPTKQEILLTQIRDLLAEKSENK